MSKQDTMEVIISRIDGAVFDGEAVSVVAPGSEGVLTILPDHEAFITPLAQGTISVETPEDTKDIEIEKGLLEVSNNQVSVLI